MNLKLEPDSEGPHAPKPDANRATVRFRVQEAEVSGFEV